MKGFIRILLVTVAGVLLAACQPSPPIEITNGYVRAMPPGQNTTAIFMDISNHTDQDLMLTEVEAVTDGSMMIHGHDIVDGVARMRHLPHLHIDAGETFSLKPGGKHLMVMNMSRELQPGETFSCKLKFDDGTTLTLDLPVKSLH